MFFFVVHVFTDKKQIVSTTTWKHKLPFLIYFMENSQSFFSVNCTHDTTRLIKIFDADRIVDVNFKQVIDFRTS